MANRDFKRLRGTLETDIVVLAGAVTFTSSSVSGLATTDTIPGVSSSLGATGKVNLTFTDPYFALRAVHYNQENPTINVLTSRISGSNMTNAALNSIPARTVVFAFASGSAGTATYPDVGSKLHFAAYLKNSALGQDK